MTTNSEIVRNFIATWSTRDLDTIMEYFAEDAVYTNVPMEPSTNIGKAAIRNFIDMAFAPVEKIDFVIHLQVEGENGVVMNERTDRFYLQGNWMELPVMGVFELRDGKISKWRDYFDMQAAAPLNAAIGL